MGHLCDHYWYIYMRHKIVLTLPTTTIRGNHDPPGMPLEATLAAVKMSLPECHPLG